MPKDQPETQNSSADALQEALRVAEASGAAEKTAETSEPTLEERAMALPEAARDGELAKEILVANDALLAAAAEGAALDQQVEAALQEAGEETLRDLQANGIEPGGDPKEVIATIRREALSDDALLEALRQSGAFPEINPERAEAALQEILDEQNDAPILELLRQSGAFPEVSEEEIESRLQALLAETTVEDKKD